MDTSTLAASLRDAILDHLGPHAVEHIAGALLLPDEVTKNLVEQTGWSLDLGLRLCSELDLEPAVTVLTSQKPTQAATEPITGAITGAIAPPKENPGPPVPKPAPVPPSQRATLVATPPMNAWGEDHDHTYKEPGEFNANNGKRFVQVTQHCKDRAEEMGIEKQRIIDAIQDVNVIVRRPGNVGDRQVIESSLEPLLLFIVQGPTYFKVVSVLWKSDEEFVRPTCEQDQQRPPPPKTATNQVKRSGRKR